MLIGIPAETLAGENRIAATPDTIKRLIKQGHRVRVQAGAGAGSHITDEALQEAGAELVDARTAWQSALVLKVRAPTAEEISQLHAGSVLVGMLEPYDKDGLQRLAAAQVTGFALESAPRTTRAQSMDVRSSQANIAGYKAVIIAADHYARFFPMLMTAAGTVKAARVVVLGVGVAGLQAIATAKRLGAVIEASDVRPSVKEQIESLGGKFIDVPYETEEEREAAQGVGGYARPMPKSWLDRQAVEVAAHVAKADVVISTALIPGRPAPVLVTEEMVASMKPGSVIVDMAAGHGAPNADGSVAGNCVLTEGGRTVVKHGVTIVGESATSLASLVATDASQLYARNVLDFLKLILPPAGKDQPPAELTIDLEDDIVAACLVTRDGVLGHGQPAAPAPVSEPLPTQLGDTVEPPAPADSDTSGSAQ